MLSDNQIDDLCCEWLYVAPGRTYEEHRPFARAIESAACAERDARITELEQQLAEARKDAERRLDLVERVRKYPENIDHKGSLLWGDILREVDRAATKEQT